MIEKNVTKIEHEGKKLEDRELSSGETKELEKEQKKFDLNFRDYKDEDTEIWNLDLENKKQMKRFFDEVEKIKYVPEYKYVINHLLDRCPRISVGEENKKDLWEYIEEYIKGEKKNIKLSLGKKEKEKFFEKLSIKEGEKVRSFGEEDYDILMSIVIQEMKDEFIQNGYIKKGARTNHFMKLITNVNEDSLRELALGLHWEYKFFKGFRKKVLRKKAINIYDRKNILLSFVLKYATKCGYNRYFEAYDLLEKLYPSQKKDEEQEVVETKILTDWFKQHLEVNGELREEYKDTLFSKADSEIMQTLAGLESMTKKEQKGKRRAEKRFKKEWDNVCLNVDKYKKECMSIEEEEEQEKKEQEKKKKEKKKQEKKKDRLNQKTYEFLYGRNVLKRKKNRIVSIKTQEMRKIREKVSGYFLDSNVFIQTRIQDNVIQAFPKDEETQRNLLLTVIFLNFVMDRKNRQELEEDDDLYGLGELDEESDEETDDYCKRLEDFEVDVNLAMTECGFMPLYSGYAYDAFLKLLLSCDSPLELFRFVWRKKTKSSN